MRAWGDKEGPAVGIAGGVAVLAFLACWAGFLIALAVRIG